MTTPRPVGDLAVAAEDSELILLPAAFAQELLWLADRASPGNIAYNVPRVRRIRGPLDLDALRRAFGALVDRHEVLRTTYASHDDQVVQVIHPRRDVPFDVIDLSALGPEAADAETARLVAERCARPFDLAADVLMRVTVLRLSATDHVLAFESHHIAFDGWSRDIVNRELWAFYQAFASGDAPSLPGLPIQYADFAIWQRQDLQGSRLDALLAWWREELRDVEHRLLLPTDFPRPAISSYAAITKSIDLDPATRDGIRQLGQRHNATTYMVLLAAYATVLHRYTGQADILVGSPIAGRARSETEGLIGYFANTIVQRARFADDPTFGDVLDRLRESALGAYDHQDVPFEKLVLELEGRAEVGHSPLFQVVFTQLDTTQAADTRIGPLMLEPYAREATTTKFDLTLFMHDRPDALRLMLRGRADLHRGETIARFLGHLRSVLDAAVVDDGVRVSALPLLDRVERASLAGWNATTVDEGAPATAVSLFEAQAARVPERVALAGAATFAELNARANQLAHHLRALGCGPGTLVGLGVDQSSDGVVAILGILKAGGAYVPVAPALPAARRAQQLQAAGARILVTVEQHSAQIPSGVAVVALDRDAAEIASRPRSNTDAVVAPDDLAYVLYTSGSTGNPKGVAVTHANVVHYARAISRVLADVPADRAGDGFDTLDGWQFGMVTTFGADLGGTSLWPSLFAGGTLHVLAREIVTDPEGFGEYVAAHPLDVLKITPNHLQALIGTRHGAELAALLPRRWIALGGEALRMSFARRLLAAGRPRVLNHYGPTEATVGVCTFEATAVSLAAAETSGAQTVPIGYPLSDTFARVVDRSGADLPVGVPGELWIGGAGVAAGYLNEPAMTAASFIRAGGEPVYRTGDRARRLDDGAIEFLGRFDHQVKIRGHRVELGEVEHALRAHPGVAAAVVVLRQLAEIGEPQFIAYVVPKQAGYAVSHADRPTAEKLKQWLATSLPDYMVPPIVLLLDALPLTPNGKVDRDALPIPGAAASASREFVEATSPVERQLATIWAEVLKKDKVGRNDNFLDLGGHSLMAIRVLGRISKTFGLRLPLRTLFDAPTVGQLAEMIEVELKLAALERMVDTP